MRQPALVCASLLMVELVGCAGGTSEAVQIAGDKSEAHLVLRYIRTAEAMKRDAFREMTAQSVEPSFAPPSIEEVDRSDEGCVLHSLDAKVRMVSAIWRCPDNTKPNVQRTFLIEAGRVTHMWNDWAEGPLVLPPS